MIGRRLVTAGTLTVLGVVLVVMMLWGVKAATAPLPSRHQDQASPTCSAKETATKRFLQRKDVTVSVYNASDRQGLASTTLAALETRGFAPGEIGNAPKPISARAEVHAAKSNDPAARLVAENLGPNVKVVVDTDSHGPGVDVYVGKRFQHLAPNGPKRIKLAKPIVSCLSAQ